MLNELASIVHEANKNWWIDINTGKPIDRNIGELLMLCVSELSEALEGHRKNLPDTHLERFMMFPVELVDCIIRILDIAGAYNIPLDEIFEQKMQYNAKRKDHTIEHRKTEGGKKY